MSTSANDTPHVMPNALRLAAAGCDDPAWIGAILMTLCGRKTGKLDRGQRIVLSMCMAESDERRAKREGAAERKRRERARKAAANDR